MHVSYVISTHAQIEVIARLSFRTLRGIVDACSNQLVLLTHFCIKCHLSPFTTRPFICTLNWLRVVHMAVWLRGYIQWYV